MKTYRSDFSQTEDRSFDDHFIACQDAGIDPYTGLRYATKKVDLKALESKVNKILKEMFREKKKRPTK